MGLVVRARDVDLERTVAIKLIHPNRAHCDDAKRRFRTEAMAAARVPHPNVVAIIEHGSSALGDFISMPFLEGLTLRRLLARHGPSSFHQARRYVEQLLDALTASHAAGVVHGDVKSDNLMIGNDDHLTLIDFGLARLDGVSSRPQVARVSGTPEYVAPERIRGAEPEVGSDLYAVGIVLYELIAGVVPFTGETSDEVYTQHLEGPFPGLHTHRRIEGLPEELESLLRCALRKESRMRFATAQQFREALDEIPGDLISHPLARKQQHARVDAAILSGDADAIIETCVELAQLLSTRHDLCSAIAILERAVTVVEHVLPYPNQTWRLFALLAGIHGALGHFDTAERHTRVAIERAAAAHSYAGHLRCHALLDRLRSRRTAAPRRERGSSKNA